MSRGDSEHVNQKLRQEMGDAQPLFTINPTTYDASSTVAMKKKNHANNEM